MIYFLDNASFIVKLSQNILAFNLLIFLLQFHFINLVTLLADCLNKLIGLNAFHCQSEMT
jgi:hypothetical protein